MPSIMSRHVRNRNGANGVGTEGRIDPLQHLALLDLVDELILENDALSARLSAASRRESALIDERDAVTRVCAGLQEKLDALRGHEEEGHTDVQR